MLYLKMFVINIEYLMCVNNNVFDTFRRSSKQMLQFDIHQSRCCIVTFINVNFDESRNVTSTFINVAMQHQI